MYILFWQTLPIWILSVLLKQPLQGLRIQNLQDLANFMWLKNSIFSEVESGIYIPDLNEHYQRMCSLFFNVIFFENIEISKESVYNFLLLPSDILHEPIKQFSDIIFEILCIVTRRMLNDHRKDGKYANPYEDYKKRLSV